MDIVPKPVMSVLGIVVDAVNAPVPLPEIWPVRVVVPDPPADTGNVPEVSVEAELA